jgi:hypothetical protein
MTHEQKLSIDILRLRELITVGATGREPNWRSMMTEEGNVAQDALRAMWARMLVALRSEPTK